MIDIISLMCSYSCLAPGRDNVRNYSSKSWDTDVYPEEP